MLRFADVVPMEVAMAGRNLDELYDHLGYHKIAWVRALPPGKMIARPRAAGRHRHQRPAVEAAREVIRRSSGQLFAAFVSASSRS